jgi:inhibitor of KinA sporulation pathway (predicted exonuclease)
MYYLIVDLEATCCRDHSIAKHEREIIEIGAVVFDTNRAEVVADFQRYVRPVRHAKLTDFCTQLTGIRQAQVESAETFPTVFAEFSTWVQQFPDLVFMHWGSYDRKALMADCYFHRIAYTLLETSIDFKKLFYNKMNLGKRAGLNETLQKVGLTFEGKPHSALSDARNTARLVGVLHRSQENRCHGINPVATRISVLRAGL